MSSQIQFPDRLPIRITPCPIVEAVFEPRHSSQWPIPASTNTQQASVERQVNYLLWFNRRLADHPAEQTTRDPLMLACWEQILNGLVYELYFPEELHAAGLRLFDLAAAADLPDITQLPEKSRLSTLRKKFEEVYDIEYPVRAALEKLQTLDTVRIIEGKE